MFLLVTAEDDDVVGEVADSFDVAESLLDDVLEYLAGRTDAETKALVAIQAFMQVEKVVIGLLSGCSSS